MAGRLQALQRRIFGGGSAIGINGAAENRNIMA